MAFGKRFNYYYSDGPTGDPVFWWDTESPVTDVPIDIAVIQASFGEIDTGYSLFADDCTDKYLYFGTTDPPPLVASFENGSYFTIVEYEIPANLDGNTRYYLKATFVNCENYGGSVTYTGYFDTEEVAPAKAINPSPADATSDVTLDQATITWEDGGGADTFDVYYGQNASSLIKVADAQAETSFTISNINYGPPFDYQVSRAWRIDATNEKGTTTGDVWTFTTITFISPPPGVRGYAKTGEGSGGEGGFAGGAVFDGNLNIKTRLVGFADNKVYYEDT